MSTLKAFYDIIKYRFKGNFDKEHNLLSVLVFEFKICVNYKIRLNDTLILSTKKDVLEH